MKLKVPLLAHSFDFTEHLMYGSNTVLSPTSFIVAVDCCFRKKNNPLIYPLYATFPAANSKKTNYLVKNVVASIRGRHFSQELAEMKTEAKYQRWIEKQLQLDYDVALYLLDV